MTDSIQVPRDVLEAAWVALNNAEDALSNSILRTQHQITKECCVIAKEFVSPSLAQLRALLDKPDAPRVEETVCPHGVLIEDYCRDCDYEVLAQLKENT